MSSGIPDRSSIYGSCALCNKCQEFTAHEGDYSICKCCGCSKGDHFLLGFFFPDTRTYKWFDVINNGNNSSNYKRPLECDTSSSNSSSAGRSMDNRKLSPDEAAAERFNARQQTFHQTGGSSMQSNVPPRHQSSSSSIGGGFMSRQSGGNSHCKVRSSTALKTPAIVVESFKPLRVYILARGVKVPTSDHTQGLLVTKGQCIKAFPYFVSEFDNFRCISKGEVLKLIRESYIRDLFQECFNSFEFLHQVGSKELIPTTHDSDNYPNLSQWKSFATDYNKSPASKVWNLVIVPGIQQSNEDEEVGRSVSAHHHHTDDDHSIADDHSSSIASNTLRESDRQQQYPERSQGYLVGLARTLFPQSSSSSSSTSGCAPPLPVLASSASVLPSTVDLTFEDEEAAGGGHYPGVEDDKAPERPIQGSLEFIRSLLLEVHDERSSPVVVDSSPDVEKCRICLGTLGPYKLVHTLPCAHTFHAHCISSWLLNHNTCPLCNYVLF